MKEVPEVLRYDNERVAAKALGFFVRQYYCTDTILPHDLVVIQTSQDTHLLR